MENDQPTSIADRAIMAQMTWFQYVYLQESNMAMENTRTKWGFEWEH